jgi:hypothetical protein
MDMWMNWGAGKLTRENLKVVCAEFFNFKLDPFVMHAIAQHNKHA